MSKFKSVFLACGIIAFSEDIVHARSFDKRVFDSEPQHLQYEDKPGPVVPFKVGAQAEMSGNMVEALTQYKTSALAGYAPAQTRLGYLFEQGKGVPRDKYSAQEWYLKAAKQGDGLAQYHLACLYQETRNYSEAVHWHTEAANRGNTVSQYELALLYESGQGVKKSVQEAFKWSELAAQDGAPTHLYARDRLSKLLSPVEVDAIRQMLYQWQLAKDAQVNIATINK